MSVKSTRSRLLDVRTDDAAVNAAEQQITLQLMAEPRIATTPSTMAQTANNELVAIAPAGYKHIAVPLNAIACRYRLTNNMFANYRF